MSEREPTATELAEAQALARALESLDASGADASEEHGQAVAAAPADALEVAALLRMTQSRAALTPQAREAILADLQSAAPPTVVPSNLRRLVRWSGVLSAAAAAVLAVLQLHPFASSPAPANAPVAAPAPPSAAGAPRTEKPASRPEPSRVAAAPALAAEAERAPSALEARRRQQTASAVAAPKQKTADAARKKSKPVESGRAVDDLLDQAPSGPKYEETAPVVAAPAAPAPLREGEAVADDLLEAPMPAEHDAVQERSASMRPRRDVRLALPSRSLAEAEARLARAARASSPQVDAALRALRVDVLHALTAAHPDQADALRDMIAAHAAVERDLERADYAAARARLTRALSQARSELATLENRVCERDLLARLAHVATQQPDARAALRYADQGLALGTRSDAFDVALLLQRANALARLGDSKASEVAYAAAAALADRLSGPR